MSRIKNVSKKGFTLIELIVVVIILGILMAVALPNFFGASNGAKDSAAQQYATIAYKNIRAAEANNQGAVPTAASLVAPGALPSAEPELNFSAAGTQTAAGVLASAQSDVTATKTKDVFVGVILGTTTPGSVYLAVPSASGKTATLTADGGTQYTPKLAIQ